MGKRKSAKKPQVRKGNEPLSTTFKCLFCHHEKAVTVKIDKGTMFGHLSCKVCGQKFQTPINNLSVAVDVYCDWVDACEEVRAKQPKKVAKPPSAPPSRRSASPERRPSKRESARDAYDDDDDEEDEDDYDRRRKVSRDYDDDDD